MPDNFKEWNEQDARARLPQDDHAMLVRRYYDGEHFDIRRWKGPRPDPSVVDKQLSEQEQRALDAARAHGDYSGLSYLEVLAVFDREVKRTFTSKNVVAEGIDRRVGGVIGKEPTWGWSPLRATKPDEEPNAEEQALIDELTPVVNAWFDEQQVYDTLEDFLATGLHSEQTTLRFYVVSDVVALGDNAAAAEAIWLEHTDPADSFVYVDPRTKRKVGIVFYKDEGGEEECELVFVDADGRTVIRRLGDAEAETLDDAVPDLVSDYQLAGQITMFTGTHRRFITRQVLELQDSLNLGCTMMPQAMGTSGYAEKIFLGVQMPGEWQYDDKGKPIPGTFKQHPYLGGPGTTSFMQPVPYEERDPTSGATSTRLTSPQVVIKEPSSVAPLVEGKADIYGDILDQMQQAHYVMASEATPSGRSREVARAEFERTLHKTAKLGNRAGRFILTVFVLLLEDLTGQRGRWSSKLRPTFMCRVDPGPRSADEQRVDMEAGAQGYKPKSMVMSALDVDDPDQAASEIAGQPDARLDLVTKQGVAATAWTAAGASLEFSAAYAGVDADEVAKLRGDIKKLKDAIYGDEGLPTGEDPNAPPIPGGPQPPQPGPRLA